MSEKCFELSLCMAGAISAGAYTGGVIDFLIEALEEWEAVRGNPGIPDHRVVLRGFAGASAGGITGALAAVALAGDGKPSDPTSDIPPDVRLKRLYEAWVLGPDMRPTDGRPGFLSLEDLEDKTKPLVSCLNGMVLDQIRDRIFANLGDCSPKPYIATLFHGYVTLSNLRGIPYQITASGDSGAVYGMQAHADRAHYVISGLGQILAPPVMADQDTANDLNTNTLPGYTPGTGMLVPGTWRSYAEAAVATGAFPFALPPRQLMVEIDDYSQNNGKTRLQPAIDFAVRVAVSKTITPSWPKEWSRQNLSVRPIVNVDGGMIDNQPFEVARQILLRQENGAWVRNPDTATTAQRAVIMIAPFPEPPLFLDKDSELSPTLKFVLDRLVGTVIDQMRFKPEELQAAADEDKFSRYLIAPVRNGPGVTRTDGAAAIACGLLGGFGGFTDVQFRHHDYMLGRRNCQRFLQTELLVDVTNPVVAGWAVAAGNKAQDAVAEAARAGRALTDADFRAAGIARPDSAKETVIARLIPLYGSAAKEVKLPPWPKMAPQTLETLCDLLATRTKKILPRILGALRLAWFESLVADWVVIPKITRSIVDLFRDKLTKDMTARGQF